MLETTYGIWEWGPKQNDGRTRQHNVGVRTKAKRSDCNAFEVANELFCMRLGHALKLPIPAGGLLQKDGLQWFSSLNFAIAPQRLAPVPCSSRIEIAKNHWLTCGILIFDAWIMNEDRSPANISYHPTTGAIHIFDHGASFWDKDGRSYFESVRRDLVICRENHCLAGHVTSLEDFDVWHQRILAIPEYFIRESLLQAVETGFPLEQVEFCFDFLLDRREWLKELFRLKLKSAFPNVVTDLFSPFKHTEPDYVI